MQINRIWAMPSKWTFDVKPIADLLSRYSVGKNWADPFAGKSRLCEFRNDLNPEHKQPHCMEAAEFMSYIHSSYGDTLSGCIFDPPYSLTQVSRSYNDIGLKFAAKENPTGSYPKVKDIIGKSVMPNAHVISFGWNTVGMGKKRGFEIVEILIVSHGGNRNDTLVTVERRSK